MGDNFHVTHRYVLDNDVRYMYSGSPLSMMYRNPDYPNFDMLRLKRENTSFRRNILQNQMNGTFLVPRNPALRSFSRHDVSGMVNRLQRTTIARVGVSEENLDKLRCRDDVMEPDKSGYASYRKLPKAQVDRIVERLLKSRTIMSSMKEYKAPLPLMTGLSTSYTKLANSKALHGVVPVVRV
ncbi:uncharacterized protein LOC134707392 [Mytilus trossulus]|uniref:uncharacterized protein LOC134707392 n=1 Tax=Mytilus trossulus TaxID=6551 RepID=UPI0030072BD4